MKKKKQVMKMDQNRVSDESVESKTILNEVDSHKPKATVLCKTNR